MLTHHPDLTASVIYGLGWVYLLLFFMNAVITAIYFQVVPPVGI